MVVSVAVAAGAGVPPPALELVAAAPAPATSWMRWSATPIRPAPGRTGPAPSRVTGPVTPSGPVSVGAPYPEVLTFTATGQPGDEITITAVDGSSRYVGPGFDLTFECDASAGHVADIPIVAP
jgi:hypothetical protein